MKKRYYLISFLSFCVFSLQVYAVDGQLQQQRQQFSQAVQALQAQQWDSLNQLAASLQTYPLYYYLRYHTLKSQLEEVDATEVYTFLQVYGKTALGDMLRRDWLVLLGQTEDWAAFLHSYAPPVKQNSGQEKNVLIQCYYVQARMETQQQTDIALQEAKNLWLSGKTLPGECEAAFAFLYRSPWMSTTLVWQRIGLAMAKGNVTLAGSLAKWLTASDQTWVTQWQAMHKKPDELLNKNNMPDVPVARDIILHGIRQVAKNQVDAGMAYWATYQRRYAFSEQQIAEIQRDIALAAAKQNHPDTLKWLLATDKRYATDKLHEVRIQVALKNQAWQALLGFIKDLPDKERNSFQSRYWQARALEKLNRFAESQQLYKELATARDYYGFLAADRLGIAYHVPHKPILASAAEETQLLNMPSISAAYEFYQLGMLSDARREWQYIIETLNSRQQTVAAALAHRWGWYDRAMLTAAKPDSFDDLEVRFPLPFREHFAAGATAQNLDLAWVYGISRQESLFMTDARSPVGALGLMQLMPATGRMMAKKAGVTLKSNQDILNIDTNISLGTTYLRQLLDQFDGNYMLATAAYNAGPGRAKRWSADYACVPADVWVEMIPFSETKTYVRRVLFYTRVFESRLGQPTRPLRVALAPQENCTISSTKPNPELQNEPETEDSPG